MSDIGREEIALRTIAVSGRSAMARATSDEQREEIRSRTDALLSELEAAVIRVGGDEEVLAAIASERRRVHEDDASSL